MALFDIFNTEEDLYIMKDDLLFLPIGGSGEIGMNVNLYGSEGKWMVADFGVVFGDESTPGFDVILPDVTHIEDRKDDLVGLFLTHAHEDHLGAIPYLWQELECPIHCTPFAAAVLKRKLEEFGLDKTIEVHVHQPGDTVEVEGFKVQFIPLTHSIPEACALNIDTKHGRIFHTGDWKFDTDPVVGAPVDKDMLKALGPVDYLMCDSTNVFVEEPSGSEAQAGAGLKKAFTKYHKRIVVASFASNIARIASVSEAAQACGRQVALVGRSFDRMTDSAFESGYLEDCPKFLTPREGAALAPDKVVFLCTGSQGETRAALTRIANGSHPDVQLEVGDVVFYSSRRIPGNEKSIAHTQNQLAERGVSIVLPNNQDIHVSGHPSKPELKELYNLLKPKLMVPVHGEPMHLHAHAAFAEECGIKRTCIPSNGSVISLTKGEAIDHLSVAPLVLDGNRIIELSSDVLRQRHRVIRDGMIVVSFALHSQKGHIIGDLNITSAFALEGEGSGSVYAMMRDTLSETINQMPRSALGNKKLVKQEVQQALKRLIYRETGKKSQIILNIH
jgi:ribonuclease J